MAKQTFKIEFRNGRDGHFYNAQVVVTYHTEQILRVTVTGGEKVLWMHKDRTRRYPWMIDGINFEMRYNDRDTAQMILDIQDAIDREM